MQTRQRKILIETLSGLFRPRPKESVVQWAERSLELDTKATAFAGPYSTSMTPYVREIINTFSDGNISKIVCCFGAQTGKTQSFMAGLAWILANDPSPAMWVMPNKELAESFSDTRLRPMLDTCAELISSTSNKRRQKKTEIEYEGALLTLVGSNSPANLSSRPVRVLILDEVDKFPLKTNKEAAALELAIERTMSFPESKIFEASTPTTIEGAIWNEFLNGDQRRYFVPCPFCKKEMILTFSPERTAFEKLTGIEAKMSWSSTAKRSDGTWDYAQVRQTAHYICPHCTGEIRDEHKMQMLTNGSWRATNPYADAGVRSYHLPTFYAPWRKASWGDLAVEFLKANKSIEGLRNFINSKCAEPDMGQYDGRTTSRMELVLDTSMQLQQTTRIMTVDVQKDHFWYLIRDWEKGGNSLCFKWGKAFSFEELSEIEKSNDVKYVGLDSGFNTTDVYRECARYSWFAMRGDDRESFTNKQHVQVPYNIRIFDPLIGTKNQGLKKIAELRWSNPTIKDILARLRNRDTSPVKWAIPFEIATEEYFRHLDGEYKKRIADAKTGKVIYRWVLRNSRWPNHILDCECMSISVAMFLGLLKK